MKMKNKFLILLILINAALTIKASEVLNAKAFIFEKQVGLQDYTYENECYDDVWIRNAVQNFNTLAIETYLNENPELNKIIVGYWAIFFKNFKLFRYLNLSKSDLQIIRENGQYPIKKVKDFDKFIKTAKNSDVE